MKVLLLLVFCLLAELEIVASVCPHDDNTLARWSKLHQNLPKNSNVSITSHVLLDTDVSVFGINIKQGGKLVVGSKVTKIDAYYILVAGEFHIGSEDCQFPGKLTITMFGRVNDQYSVEGLTCQKCINVIVNGVIEMHGQFKRPWTKLAASLHKVVEEDFIYNEIASKAEDKLNPEDKAGTGMLVRTFDSVTGKLKEKYSFNFRKKRFRPHNMAIIKNITKEQNDDCVLIAVRKAIIGKGQTGGGPLDELYDELEKLGHGKVTNNICLREHKFYDAFAMVACKGDKSLTRNSCGKYKLGNRFQKVEQCLVINELKLCSTSFSNSRNHGTSFAVFQVTERETTTPKLTLAQVPTNWTVGDEVCVTSTDYNWRQVECGEIVKCSDCNDKQIRIGLTTLYDHYGKVTDNVDMRAEVFVNSRNILLTSDMESFTAVDGGMVKFSEGFKTAKIENVEIENFGDSSQIGVYPVHYHLCKDVQGTTYIRNNAIHDSWSRCVVVHGTMGAVVDWNTCYICKGHAYFTEDAAEKHTTFINNLGLGTMRTSTEIFTTWDSDPATFFISNPFVTFTGNVAAGGESRGIKVIFPDQPTGLSASFGVMEKYEAMKTPMSMDNNVAHSYRVGFEFRDRLTEQNRRQKKSLYQPQDSEGNPKETKISRLTVYKNKEMNAAVEGGLVKVTQSSFADSPVGLELLRGFDEGKGNLVLSKSTNDLIKEEPGQKPCLLNSVIVGDSDNIGNPNEGEERSLPNEVNNAVALNDQPIQLENFEKVVQLDLLATNESKTCSKLTRLRRLCEILNKTCFCKWNKSSGTFNIAGLQNVFSIYVPGKLYRKPFEITYNYAEIQTILLHQHGIILSLRQLHRILRHLGLRRNSTVQREVARQAIKHELEGCGSCLGYRSMTRRLLTKHGLSVSRALVADLLRELDSDGVAMRAMHRFSRRVYINKGPNYLIHVDGYDKLKPFGFPIHGAICGFSRRVLWLKVANTNNNPNVVATHFMEYVNEIKGVPRCIRIDNGTENVMIEDVQMAFRWDDLDEMAAEKSVLRGSSHSNQRIERWWRSNKEGGCQFWIDLFKDLVDSGNLSLSNELHIECMRFCFMDVLQKELNLVRMEWNQHPVRSCRSESPAGKPDILFHLPGLYDSVDYKIEVRQEDIDAVQQYCQVEFSYGCSEEYSVVFTRCLNELGKPAPSTADEALEQFMILKETLDL